jgi:hypothetical protein
MKNAPLVGGIFIILSLKAHAQADGITLMENYKAVKYPGELNEVIKIVLPAFQEVMDKKIKISFSNSRSPLVTRPAFNFSFLSRKKRSYCILISVRTMHKLQPLLFNNLPFEAQVGVLSHEFSHVADFSSCSAWKLMKKGFQRLSSRGIDRMEFNTDLFTIEHGMGKYLLQWSIAVRERLNIISWKGRSTFHVNRKNRNRERYMNPDTIRRYMMIMENRYRTD